jgi:tRNA A37 N6-isopentenylltransferase MiaA
MLEIVPITLSEAKAFVTKYHRHHAAPLGGLFAIGISDDEKIVGVAIVGRPVARMADNGWTAEVTRLCTDNTPHVASKLYSACWRAARAIGYKKLITYILNSEPGTSLKAAGWKCLGECGGGSWSRDERPRVDKHPLQTKIKWEACLEAVKEKE